MQSQLSTMEGAQNEIDDSNENNKPIPHWKNWLYESRTCIPE